MQTSESRTEIASRGTGVTRSAWLTAGSALQCEKKCRAGGLALASAKLREDGSLRAAADGSFTPVCVEVIIVHHTSFAARKDSADTRRVVAADNNVDIDGDGYTNLEEYLNGTDPGSRW